MLGSCPQLSVGPEAALALIVGQAISSIMHSDPHGPPENPYAVAIAASTIITFQVSRGTYSV
jgi:MFS superfamily sulfate permease-like transporter